jgi:hypothetical protein
MINKTRIYFSEEIIEKHKTSLKNFWSSEIKHDRRMATTPKFLASVGRLQEQRSGSRKFGPLPGISVCCELKRKEKKERELKDSKMDYLKSILCSALF